MVVSLSMDSGSRPDMNELSNILLYHVEDDYAELDDVAKIISNPFLTKRSSASDRVHSRIQPGFRIVQSTR